MGEVIAFEYGRIFDFQGLVTLTLTLDRIILHTFMHHSSTSTYTPNFIEIEETFCGRTDGQACGRTFETGFVRSTLRSRPKNDKEISDVCVLMHKVRNVRCLSYRSLQILEIQIIGITESWGDDKISDAEFSIPGFSVFRSDRKSRPPHRGGGEFCCM